MELLIGKKALLALGGAGSATAITLPLVLTQTGSRTGQDNSDMEGVDWDHKLDLSSSEIHLLQNKPGDCIKKSFPGLEKMIPSQSAYGKGFFYRPQEMKMFLGSGYAAADANKNGNKDLTNFDFACLTFNKQEDSDEFKLELTIRKDTTAEKRGWLWMSGLKKVSSGYIHYFKEAVVNADGTGNWKAFIGLDGEYSVINSEDVTPNFSDEVFDGIKKRKTYDCNEEGDSCVVNESLNGVWTRNDDSALGFLPSEVEDISNSILAFGNDYNYKNKANKRKNVYGGSKWWGDNPAASKQAETVKLNAKQLLGDQKGNWTDIYTFCSNEEENSEQKPFKFLCS